MKTLKKKEGPTEIKINLNTVMMLDLKLKKVISSILSLALSHNLLHSKIRLHFPIIPLPTKNNSHSHNESLNNYQLNVRKPKLVITGFLY